ncbi:MAG TPA: hypothetical protein VJA66_16270 [Thermoanaerobaculia bacterium]
MKRTVLGSIAVSIGLIAAGAKAQAIPSCAAGKTGKPPSITAQEAWELASKRAHDWQADAIPFDFTTTSLGPLDAEGKSKDWEVKFSSTRANAVNMISVNEGQIRCYAIKGAGGRPLKLVDSITFDSKKLYETAQKAGGDKVGAGATIMAGLEQGTNGLPEWILNYQNAQGKEVLSVIIDAKSGKVQHVFHGK